MELSSSSSDEESGSDVEMRKADSSDSSDSTAAPGCINIDQCGMENGPCTTSQCLVSSNAAQSDSEGSSGMISNAEFTSSTDKCEPTIDRNVSDAAASLEENRLLASQPLPVSQPVTDGEGSLKVASLQVQIQTYVQIVFKSTSDLDKLSILYVFTTVEAHIVLLFRFEVSWHPLENLNSQLYKTSHSNALVYTK